jgi:hypothetical protein
MVIKSNGGKEMANLKETAQTYESGQTTKNVAELDEVSVDLEVKDDSFEATDDEGNQKTVKIKYIEVGDERYRVPNSVLKQLKVFLEDNSDLKKFKVKKSGQGLNTEYQVIPILKP